MVRNRFAAPYAMGARTACALLLGCALTAPAAADDKSAFPPSIASYQGTCTDSDGTYAYTCSADFSGDRQAYATVTNGRESPLTAPTNLTVTLSGTGSLSGQDYGYVYSTFGVTGADNFAADSSGTEPPSYAAGGSVTITNDGDLTMYSMVASNIYFTPAPGQYDTSPGYWAWGGGAIVGLSVGAEGFSEKSEQGGDPNFDGGDGGAVTVFNQGFVSIGASGQALSYDSTTLPAMANAIGAFSIGGDGWGNRTDITDHAGDGGDGGTIAVTNNSNIVVNNLTPTYGGQPSPPANAIFAVSQGGIGNIDNSEAPYGNTGGAGGSVTVTNAGSITGGNIGPVIGIFAVSVGGDSNQFTRAGGASNDKTSFAGNGGPVQVVLDNGSVIDLVTQGPALGVMAISAGGYADNNRQGSGGTSTVTIGDNATVSTSGGSLSIGVLAVSAGTLADISPYTTGEVNTAYPGTPGAVTVTNNGSVTSTGQMAVGIAGVSAGGTAVVTNGDAYGSNVLGNAADGYGGFSGDTVSITNAGSVTTSGPSAHGIVALSAGGGGGLINLVTASASTALGSQTTGDSGGGNGAKVTVTNSGSITTGNGPYGGEAAIGIVAQSIGGGGGSSGGGASFLGGLDAEGAGGGSGGEIGVTTSGSSAVTTMDSQAIGILAQSVGGGGGNGANAWGVIAAVGGGGGNGGTGGTVNVTLGGAGSVVSTAGVYAAGVVAQSIGGGGGNGGYAESFGSLSSIAVGGRGGAGGSGGAITISNAGQILTEGDQSWGVVAQSVGGGGGSGGAASSYSAGVITVALALGGTGGEGGGGDTITVTNTGSILTGYTGSESYSFTGQGPATLGADAHGILAQSIGGGGGAGGSATARSLGLPSSDIPTITVDFAHGGTGGSGGDGGEITITNNGSVKTAGDGAYGIIAQSIGGGGGAGGDSTAAAYSLQSGMPDINLSMALGGSGAAGGSGGAVTVTNGATTDCSDCVGTIETYGDNAIGIEVHSIGGGGGTGGTGNASTSSASLGNLLADGTGLEFAAAASVGGSGGSGNVGGTVVVSNGAGSTIRTYGSSSYGIQAQSIGGGGGSAGSSSAGSGAGNIQLDVSIGGTGGSGNDGGKVTVTNDGTITTGGTYTMDDGTLIAVGGDAIGIFAQSVGGGGGSGGGTDPATTFGFGGQLITTIKSLATNKANQSPSLSISYSASVDIGGKGGAGGAGGDVAVTNTGAVTTYGQRSYGIEAQSIGGGGGNGGTATSNTSTTWSTIDADLNALGYDILAVTTGAFNMSLGANVSVGGDAGDGSVGGTVTVTNSGSVTTAGYAAHAILAQSVGGGGGIGADGTPGVSTNLGLGIGYAGSGGNGNAGGAVSVTDSGRIIAVGDDAYGILAQSIGGGGGAAGAGCTNSSPQYAQLGVEASQCLENSLASGTSETFSGATLSLDIGVQFKGSAGTEGDGNTVTIDKSGGSIITGGARAMGIVAQSIGGAGGLAVGSDENVSSISYEGISTSGDGGDITVGLGVGASVTTYGDGAWGIFAQSIGAGGGFFGDSSLDLGFANVNTLPQASGATVAGGDITVTLAGDITTSGSNAHGLVVQTSGAGNSGGAGVDGRTMLGADLGSSQGLAYGVGGTITVNQTGGTISASGDGSVGIVAQSIGTLEQQNEISITVSGAVQGGTGSNAAGILVSGGYTSDNINTGTGANWIDIQPGGSVSTADGVSGMAILALNSWIEVNNAGTLIGSVGLYEGSSRDTTFANNVLNNTGVFASGPVVDVGAMINAGTLSVGGDRHVATSVFGLNFEQTPEGTLNVDIDALGSQTADLLQVAGEADFGGGIKTLSSNLLPGTYTVLQAGALTNEGFTGVAASLLFDWSATFGTTSLTIAPNADFTPAGATLTTNEASFAAYLQRTWDAGGSDSLAPLYGALSDIYSGTDYAAALDDVSGETLSVHANDQALATRIGLDGAFSCPVFVGDGTLLGETSCVWGKVEGGVTRHGTSTGSPGYTEDRLTLRTGGQGEVAPDWFVGGSMAYSTTSADADGLGAGSDGERVDVSLAAKRVRDAWYVGLGGNVGYGWYDNHRRVSIYGPSQLVTSDSDVFTAGARARVQYEVPFANWYLRPRADLDLIYAHVPAYSESGPTGVTMDVRAQNETTVAFAPYLELGGRFEFGDAWVARPYAGAGVVAMTNDTWTTEASLIGAPASAGTFTIESDVPNVLGQLDLGLQLTRGKAFEARLEYGLDFGYAYQSSEGSLRIGFEF